MNWNKWLGVLWILSFFPTVIWAGYILSAMVHVGEPWSLTVGWLWGYVLILLIFLAPVSCIAGVVGAFFPKSMGRWSTKFVLFPIIPVAFSLVLWYGMFTEVY